MTNRRYRNTYIEECSHLAFLRERANGRSLCKVWKERLRAVALYKEDAVLVH